MKTQVPAEGVSAHGFQYQLRICAACLILITIFPVWEKWSYANIASEFRLEEKDDCIKHSLITLEKVRRWGYAAYIWTGWSDNGEKHQCIRYWNDTRREWCIWDDAIWYVRKSPYTAIELGYREDLR